MIGSLWDRGENLQRTRCGLGAGWGIGRHRRKDFLELCIITEKMHWEMLTDLSRIPNELTRIFVSLKFEKTLTDPQESTRIRKNPQESTRIHKNPQESARIRKNPPSPKGTSSDPPSVWILVSHQWFTVKENGFKKFPKNPEKNPETNPQKDAEKKPIQRILKKILKKNLVNIPEKDPEKWNRFQES